LDANNIDRFNSIITEQTDFIDSQNLKIEQYNRKIATLSKKIQAERISTQTKKIQPTNGPVEGNKITQYVETLDRLKSEKEGVVSEVKEAQKCIEKYKIKRRIAQIALEREEIARQMVHNMHSKNLPSITLAEVQALNAVDQQLLISEALLSREDRELKQLFNSKHARKAVTSKDNTNSVVSEDTMTRREGLARIKEMLGLENVGQKVRKETIKSIRLNAEEFFNRIRENYNKDPAHIARLEKELLEAEEVESSLKSKTKKKKTNKGKRGKKKTGKKGNPLSASASSVNAPPLKRVETDKDLLDRLYEKGPIPEGFVRINSKLKVWQRSNAEIIIRKSEKYSGLDEMGLQQQFLGHFIGMHAERLFNNEQFKNDFIRSGDGDFIMICSATLKSGEEIYGKISFLINEKKEVFHRMFFKANIKENLESFLSKKAEMDDSDVEFEGGGGGGGGAAAEEAWTERSIGRFNVEIHENSRAITYTFKDNPLVESYTVFSFNKL